MPLTPGRATTQAVRNKQPTIVCAQHAAGISRHVPDTWNLRGLRMGEESFSWATLTSVSQMCPPLLWLPPFAYAVPSTQNTPSPNKPNLTATRPSCCHLRDSLSPANSQKPVPINFIFQKLANQLLEQEKKHLEDDLPPAPSRTTSAQMKVPHSNLSFVMLKSLPWEGRKLHQYYAQYMYGHVF